MSTGDYARAEPLLQRSLEQYERTLERTHGTPPAQLHFDTLAAARRLGMLRERQGHPDEALALFERVMEGRMEHLGKDHPKTVVSRSDLGNCRVNALLLLAEGASPPFT